MNAPENHRVPADLPLFVDLDGTLLNTDSLHECIIASLCRAPAATIAVLPHLFGPSVSRAKQRLAELAQLDVSRLPFNEDVLAYIRGARAAGRKVYLATAADAAIAAAIAAHVGLFDGVLAGDGRSNLKGPAKLESIRAAASGSFEYLGDAQADTVIWEQALRASTVARSRFARHSRYIVVGERKSSLSSALVRALRPHQWAKNLLIFLPLLAAHAGDPLLFLRAAVMFVAFCACASGTYVMNDLIDVQHDRLHPRKRRRPFASGAVPLAHGVLLAPLLFVAAFACVFPLGSACVAVLGLYVAIGAAYSLWFKRFELLDTLILAALYTIRVVAGFASTGVVLSFWMLAFSLFIFVSLAFLKRFSELRDTSEHMRSGRGYFNADTDIVAIMGICSGFIAVFVLALYIDSDAVSRLYAHPTVLWGIVPVALYWIAGCWFDAARGAIHDDPVIYVLTHRRSLLTLLTGLIVCVAAVI